MSPEPTYDEAEFRIAGDSLDWEAMAAVIAEGVDPLDLENRETPFAQAFAGLLDFGQIDAADDPEAEAVRQANEILQGDLKVCREMIANSSLGGMINGRVAIEVSDDGTVRTRGKIEPEGSEYLTPFWRFIRLDYSGALAAGGIVED